MGSLQGSHNTNRKRDEQFNNLWLLSMFKNRTMREFITTANLSQCRVFNTILRLDAFLNCEFEIRL